MTLQPQRTLTLTRDRHIINVYKPNQKKRIRYNLKLLSMQRYDERAKSWIDVKHQYNFFRGFDVEDIKFSDEKFNGMIKKTRELNPGCRNVSSFIARMQDAIVYDNYEAQGIKTECCVDRDYNGNINKKVLTKPLEWYDKHVIDFFKKHKIRVTTKIEKEFIRYGDFLTPTIMKLESMDFEDETKLKIFNEIFGVSDNNYWSSSTTYIRELKELIGDFRYDFKSLMKYIIDYLIPFENFTLTNSLTTLRDYYRMASAIGRHIDKFPKYLHSMHDIITANYNASKKKYDERVFKLKVENHKYLEHIGKDFCVVNPKKTKDILSEGTSLNHCVSSYVNKIIKGDTYIFFLRSNKDPEKPLVTLELNDNTIVQARGSCNRVLKEEEEKYLKAYCVKKGMELRL